MLFRSFADRIQECHIVVGHLLCEILDEAFAPSLPVAPATHAHKHLTLPELVAWREDRRTRKQTVVWTNGVFDVFHIGHLESLRAARAFGDVLIVGVNGDDSVRANKGPDRPIFPCT